MPTISRKPNLNQRIEITLGNGRKKPGMWDGANWWIETQVGAPMVPVRESFLREWRAYA